MNTRQILKVSALVLFSPVLLFSLRSEDLLGVIGTNDPAALKVPSVEGPEIWKDPSQPLDARVQDLVRRMSLAEKASQLSADAIAIPRLGIPAYSYRNECNHGVWALGHKGVIATQFPQVIGMAATWDTPLIHKEADVIATEARALFNDYTGKHDGNSAAHAGTSFYAPNINIDRDPRWGRSQETYGEDPFLTAQFGVAFIQGLQGDDPKYVKAMACAKHFAVHSGPEAGRYTFDAKPSERDLYETYLPAFEAAVREGRVGGVMGSYNALYGVPACENSFLLTTLLRQRWGFQGFVVSDGGAIQCNWVNHKYEATPEEAAANAIKAGCDLFSGPVEGKGGVGWWPIGDCEALGRMLQKGLISEKEINAAVGLTLAARFRLGVFDPLAMVPWSKYTMAAQNDTPEHQALALKVAEESIVLLKNGGLLPLDRAKIKRIAVIGPNADSVPAVVGGGNYNGTASHPVTILEGIKQVAGTNIEVTYELGCPPALKNDNTNKPTPEMTAQAVAAAKSADVVIYIGGINSLLENEGGDRARI
jgi:beta-glucosidase